MYVCISIAVGFWSFLATRSCARVGAVSAPCRGLRLRPTWQFLSVGFPSMWPQQALQTARREGKCFYDGSRCGVRSTSLCLRWLHSSAPQHSSHEGCVYGRSQSFRYAYVFAVWRTAFTADGHSICLPLVLLLLLQLVPHSGQALLALLLLLG